MPMFEFHCNACEADYEELTPFDLGGDYALVTCPRCASGSKRKFPSRPSIAGTSSKMENFGYRAGHNMERAQGERRYAEANSHMGTDVFDPIDDTHLDTGIHDNENAADDAWL